jgi:hypothetical protein
VVTVVTVVGAAEMAGAAGMGVTRTGMAVAMAGMAVVTAGIAGVVQMVAGTTEMVWMAATEAGTAVARLKWER